ncbi:hypothetical protein [Mesorhizobium xinjiangense]|uniref:hypothetical protein n=1 Tax=Mesorhizobium xinjiangense TaxID=2678685 RepID=UPI0012EE880F|nr:hypothetical protein [Mesorhizobium xinjiangense]
MTRSLIGAFLLTALSAVAADPSLAQPEQDPDWPCIQRKVPRLSLPQIWTGPQLPEATRKWSQENENADLVARLSQRRIPIEEAQADIRTFADSVTPQDDREPRLLMLARGLFDRMNRERSEVISGIGRYARKQTELAASLRAEQGQIDALGEQPDADANALAQRTDALVLKTRLFQERAQSLEYVCEVPRLIERRLYQLAQTIAGLIAKEK